MIGRRSHIGAETAQKETPAEAGAECTGLDRKELPETGPRRPKRK